MNDYRFEVEFEYEEPGDFGAGPGGRTFRFGARSDEEAIVFATKRFSHLRREIEGHDGENKARWAAKLVKLVEVEIPLTIA